MTNLSNEKVTTLRTMAKEQGIAKYYSMNKEQLIKALSNDKGTDIMAIPTTTQTQKESAQTMTNNTKDNSFIVTDFDIKRYAEFKPSTSMTGRPITANQLNLVKSLENNFKVTINTKDCKNFYELSNKLSAVYQAILSGKVQRRPYEDVEARVKAYAPAQDNKATKAQLEAITKLEKETGITVTTVISSKTVADTVIKNLIAQRQTLAQVAVDKAPKNAVQSKLEDKTFRTKFVAFLKRALA